MRFSQLGQRCNQREIINYFIKTENQRERALILSVREIEKGFGEKNLREVLGLEGRTPIYLTFAGKL